MVKRDEFEAFIERAKIDYPNPQPGSITMHDSGGSGISRNEADSIAIAGRLFHFPRSAAFRAGAKVVLFAQANRLHASVLARRVALGAVAFYFHLVGHAHLCGGLA